MTCLLLMTVSVDSSNLPKNKKVIFLKKERENAIRGITKTVFWWKGNLTLFTSRVTSSIFQLSIQQCTILVDGTMLEKETRNAPQHSLIVTCGYLSSCCLFCVV